MVKSEDLLGAWKIESWEISYSDGRASTFPFGTTPTGLILYTPDGHMSATISRSDREPMSNPNTRRAPQSEKADAFDSYFHYSGIWRIDGNNVIHTVEHALDPLFVGTDQVREMDYRGDVLVLAASSTTASGSQMHNRITWRRPEGRE
jgi:hypothetical protein